MQYRLLRNNKESGPYTKAQLQEMGLKPYDLLWLEGRGGAWLYASEFEDLKSIAPAVEEQPYDRFYKGKEKASETTASSKQQAGATNTATATLKPPKPRIRITGDKVVMIDNAALQQPQPISNIIATIPKEPPVAVAPKAVVKQEAPRPAQTVAPGWEDVYSDWKAEDTSVTEKKKPAKVQTIEEVKQRYEEAKLKQRDEKHNKTAGAARQNIMAGIAIVVLAIGGYAGYRLNNGSDTGSRTTQAAPTEKADLVQDENNPQQTALNGTDTSTDTPANNATTTQQTPNNTVATPAVDNNAKKDGAVPEKSTPVSTLEKPVEKKQQEQLTEDNKAVNGAAAVTAPAKDNKEDNVQADTKKANTTTAPVQTAPVVTTPVVKQDAPAKKISDYINVSKLGGNNTGSVQNVLLSVKNVSDFSIDLAVIDIQYFGANGRLQKGETMYVKNIGAGSNVNVRIPDGKTSHFISYKVSLVSSEQKTLYLVGD